jgi:hypothetical protein
MNNNLQNMAMLPQQPSLFPPQTGQQVPIPQSASQINPPSSLPAGVTISSNGNLHINTSGISCSSNIGQGVYYAPYVPMQSFPFYKWNRGHKYPKHLLQEGTKVAVAMETPVSTTLMFHSSVWIETCNPNEDDYGLIWEESVSSISNLLQNHTPAVNPKNTGVLLIREGKTLDEFNEWFMSYKTYFKGDIWRTQQLPTIREGEPIAGTPIAHGETVNVNAEGGILATDKLFDRWCWITQNTHEPVWFMPDFWLFNNSSEMLMYKLIDEK